MKNEKKYALLDADFVIKTIIAQKDCNNHLIDLLLDKLDCEFICHEKTLEEVSFHDKCGAEAWLKGKNKKWPNQDILRCRYFGITWKYLS